jgi:phosphoglycerate dehydrogenase-like enzyme
MIINLITSSARPTQKQIEEFNKLGEFKIIDAQKWTAKDVISNASDAEILVAGTSGVQTIDKELLSGLKNLKYISTLTVGMDWVDLKAAKELNIPISNIKGANSESVAEHTWGMILDVAKRITEFNRDAISKGAFKFGDYRGIEVYGKTLGIIGLGDIGKKVARIARGFDMRVLGLNKSSKAVEGVELVDLLTLLKESDVITICVPFTPETNNIIDAKEIEQMKHGVIIVNPARPEMTNKEAILKGLESGKIFGFGIETDIMQPIPQDDPYLTHPRIIATPHNAFNTVDAEIKSFDTVIENIKSFISGSSLNRVV